MILRLPHASSISAVNQASNPLRSQSRPGHRKTFFAVCIEMVLGPKQAAVSALVPIPGCGDRAPVEAVVPAEPGILARHRGAYQVRGDVMQRAPALVDAVTFDKTDQHQGCSRRR